MSALLIKLELNTFSFKKIVKKINYSTSISKKRNIAEAIALVGSRIFNLGLSSKMMKISTATISNIPDDGVGDMYLKNTKSKVLSLYPLGSVTQGQALVCVNYTHNKKVFIGLSADGELFPDLIKLEHGFNQVIRRLNSQYQFDGGINKNTLDDINIRNIGKSYDHV